MDKNQKSYAESVGQSPFDWVHFLSTPDAWDIDRLHDAKKRVEKHTTGITSSFSAVIPRFKNGKPKDRKLWSLEHQFNMELQEAVYARLTGCYSISYVQQRMNKAKSALDEVGERIAFLTIVNA